MTKNNQCIGFGVRKGSCKNLIHDGSNYWCIDCDQMRASHLNRKMLELDEYVRNRKGNN